MIIRTVNGDIAPEQLGLTLGHDHIIAVPPADVDDSDLLMDDEQAAINECALFRAAGGSGVVEMTTVDYGRQAAALARVGVASQVHIVSATAFNKGKFADRLSGPLTDEQIARWMIAEVSYGVCGARVGGAAEENGDVRCGLIKASSGLNGANSNELKVFADAIQAHLASGAPTSTHTEKGTWALEQAALFLQGGVAPGKVLIGHLDLKPDLAYSLEVGATGVNMGIDQFSKEKYLPDSERVRLVTALVERGFGQQLMIGGDMAWRSYFQSYNGGSVLSHIPQTIAASLRKQIGQAALDDILINNPRRWLSFTPQQ